MSDDWTFVVDEHGFPKIEVGPDLRHRLDLHDLLPATAGGRTCARCGFVVTLTNLNDVGACLTPA